MAIEERVSHVEVTDRLFDVKFTLHYMGITKSRPFLARSLYVFSATPASLYTSPISL